MTVGIFGGKKGFDVSPSGSASNLPSLTLDRVKKVLEGESFSYQVDSDGDVFARWESGWFVFEAVGEKKEILTIRGQWYARPPAIDIVRAVDACNDWNRDKLWPKTYARVVDDQIRLCTEHNVDYEFGVSDEQLKQHLICTVQTSISFFESLESDFPHAWDTYRASQED
ncbi:YbjN domain-containing protein [Timonella senegalensis]|uniref:YbjN domain-containing protein n=1 Tax=Timonella senegalensis TaxID=1465825 RepID=UPI0028AFA88A|nr:YbjN domain-containing protein [Timonella senegalensis]